MAQKRWGKRWAVGIVIEADSSHDSLGITRIVNKALTKEFDLYEEGPALELVSARVFEVPDGS